MAEEHNLLYVPEILEENILVRLPVKSIVRFKSVSKRWHTLFRSKAFEEFYFGLQDKEAFVPRSEDLGLICPELGTSTTSVMGPFSNGIYALTSFLLNPLSLKTALFNPATRQVKFTAPFPDVYLPLLSGISSSRSSVHCGVDDGYRVVVLIKHDGAGSMFYIRRICFLVFFYTWRTGLWEKLIDHDPFLRPGLPEAPGVFKKNFSFYENMMACSQKLLNGCWHWMIDHSEEEETGCSEFRVLSFDFERKLFELIPGPPCKPTIRADVFVLLDHLAAIVANDGLLPRFEIWRKTKTMWTNIYSVNSTQFLWCSRIIVHGVDYYQVEEEVKIRRLILIVEEVSSRHTFDEMGHHVDYIDGSNSKTSLGVDGISKFTPTFEPLPL